MRLGANISSIPPDSLCSSTTVGTATRTPDLFSCISLSLSLLPRIYAQTHITIIMHLNDLVDTALIASHRYHIYLARNSPHKSAILVVPYGLYIILPFFPLAFHFGSVHCVLPTTRFYPTNILALWSNRSVILGLIGIQFLFGLVRTHVLDDGIV
ncbi:hypothetical protein BKA82DRAFT_809039 [Pisolithus tinctorius]|uniref:Uncharacterized protein n=1 Tax=Pisolithus tinctorius Marx 270 TaxID=870435 RepID=A0A0C3NEY5_PISTI|nr:hypothetical protein BKA82DRAFT_809039 [Pisolithus tinctorius]KIN99634.1 hypothetical protein M404DRAFT_809039 [Pisolithus tinctorius Marx 270]